jgi:hypothetical protein
MMTLHDILEDIHALIPQLAAFERKYGLLSETFYEWYSQGYEPADDNWVLDFVEWAGLYKIWLDRLQEYRETLRARTTQTRGVARLFKETMPA